MMDISKKYCFYVGTTQGTIEYTFCIQGEKIPYCLSPEPSEVTALEWGRSDDEIITGFKNGNVSLYNCLENKYVKNLTKLEGTGPVVGVGCLNKEILIGRHDGIINIWNGKTKDYFSINLDEKGTMDCMVYNSFREGVLGTGGEFNDFKLWDIETKTCIFKAKSMGHDMLNLPIPTSVKGITFLPDNLNIVATKEGHVLLYDERVQRRPVVKFLEPKASYTCIANAFRDRQVLVGTTRGYMQLIDMKIPGKCIRTFTTFTGSVTSIVCDSMEPLVATSSLDRHLRVHNLDSKELIYKSYLKQRLCKILMKPVVKEETNDLEKTNEIIDEEYDELFEKMETISEKNKVKKKKVKVNKEEDNEITTKQVVKLKKKKSTNIENHEEQQQQEVENRTNCREDKKLINIPTKKRKKAK